MNRPVGLPCLEDVDAMPTGALPGFLLELAALQARAAVRLQVAAVDATPPVGPERLLTIDEAAVRCCVSKDWLYRHKNVLPFTRRLGRAVRFSEHALDQWLATRGR